MTHGERCFWEDVLAYLEVNQCLPDGRHYLCAGLCEVISSAWDEGKISLHDMLVARRRIRTQLRKMSSHYPSGENAWLAPPREVAPRIKFIKQILGITR